MEPQEYPEDIDFIKYWLILKRHWLKSTGVACLAVLAALFAALNSEKEYSAYGKLRLKKLSTTSALVTDAGEKIGTLDTLNMKNTPLDTEAEVIRSAPIVNRAIKELNLKSEEGEPISYEDFLKKLGVSGVLGTDILGISYETREPDDAVKIVNKVMELYIENNIWVNRAEAAAARKFISEQLPKKEQQLREAEIALRNFKEQNKIIDLGAEASSIVSTIETLNTQLDQTQASIARISSQIIEMENKLGFSSKEALTRSALTASPGVQEVEGKLNAIEDQLASLKTRFLDSSPEVMSLENEKVALEALLRERVQEVVGTTDLPRGGLQNGAIEQTLAANLVAYELEHEGLLKQLNSLQKTRQEQTQRALLLPQLQQTQGNLERQVQVARNTYDILVNRLQQVSIAENQNVGNAQIVSPAIASEYPVSSSKKVIAVGGVVAGIMLYVVTAFLSELMDPSIKTLKEIRHLFNRYTLLAMIPAAKRRMRWAGIKIERTTSDLPVLDEPHSIISESYRMLQANLNFISPDQELKVIVVTSAVSKEGKSKVSANLAATLAQLGKQVLLIDADLRYPRQHHLWDLTYELNPKGLSDVIVNQAGWEWAVRTVMTNLDVLPAGVIPPNSLALLASKRMSFLVEDFRKAYDFVIFDTPSLLLVADALTLSKVTDGILLVVRPGTIDTVSASAARELLVKSGQNVLGLVVNDLKIENEPDSYFHHAKDYSYQERKQPRLPRFKVKK